MNRNRLILVLLWLCSVHIAYGMVSADSVSLDQVTYAFPLDEEETEVLVNDSVELESTDSVAVELDTKLSTSEYAKDPQTYVEYEWRNLRSTRDTMRDKMRNARRMYRREVHILRDSVRTELYEEIVSMPHEIRVGCGDAFFEALAWHSNPYAQLLPESYTAVYNEDYRYTQHLFCEYLYNLSYWYSIGGMVDYSGVLWDEVTRNGQGKELQRVADKQFHNIVIMPVVRFSYWHTEYISLYSALGLGVNINTGTEIDYKGRETAVALAANITLLGIRIGKKHFFGSLELGGMSSLMSTNEIYMLGSRLFTASLGYRF